MHTLARQDYIFVAKTHYMQILIDGASKTTIVQKMRSPKKRCISRGYPAFSHNLAKKYIIKIFLRVLTY